MNRAERILWMNADRATIEHYLMMSGSIDRINKMGPDRWMKWAWGLSGRAAESAWWGCLDVMGQLRPTRKERR